MGRLSSRFLKEKITLYGISQVGGSGDSGEVDRYGDPVYAEINLGDWWADVSTANTTEDEDQRDTFITFYNFVVEADCPVEGISSVVWRGRTFEIIGEPQLFYDSRELHHKEFLGRTIEG